MTSISVHSSIPSHDYPLRLQTYVSVKRHSVYLLLVSLGLQAGRHPFPTSTLNPSILFFSLSYSLAEACIDSFLFLLFITMTMPLHGDFESACTSPRYYEAVLPSYGRQLACNCTNHHYRTRHFRQPACRQRSQCQRLMRPRRR